MASLPPEPAEGCTLRLEIQPRGQAPRRLERKFDGDDTGEIVLRWLAAEGCADDAAIDNLLLLGAVHFQLGRWEDCARHTLRCIKRAPGVAESYSNLANALKELGDPRGVDAARVVALAAVRGRQEEEC